MLPIKSVLKSESWKSKVYADELLIDKYLLFIYSTKANMLHLYWFVVYLFKISQKLKNQTE